MVVTTITCSSALLHLLWSRCSLFQRLLADLSGTARLPLSSTLHQDPHQHLQHQEDAMMMPYLCAFCSKRFRRRDGLVLHIRTHTGERPYACPHCPVAFAQKSHLNRHIRTVHKIEPNSHLSLNMLFNNDTPGPSQNDSLGHIAALTGNKNVEIYKADNQNGDTNESHIHIPSPLFPHVQISNVANESAISQDWGCDILLSSRSLIPKYQRFSIL